MLNLFKKELKCGKCTNSLEKDKYHIFDATYRGKYKNGEKLKLCTVCLVEKYKEYLLNFKYRAIIIEPFNIELNSYQYYTFEDMLEFNWPKQTVNKIREMLPSKGECIHCSKETSFLFCSPDVYSRNPEAFDINYQYKGILLCPNCIATRLRQAIESEQLFFGEVLPPLNAEGVSTSFEY